MADIANVPPRTGGSGDQVVIGTNAVAGSAVFSNSNNVTWGVNTLNGIVTASASFGHTGPVALQASGTAIVTNGTVQFATSPTVTFGLVGSTITASAATGAAGAAAQMSFWVPGVLAANALNFSAVSRPFFFPLNQLAPMQGAMTWDTAGIALSGNSTMTTADAHTYSLSLGIYRLNNATQISLINSVSWTTGLAASASSYQELYAGTRFITFHSSQWSAQPSVVAQSSYWGAVIISTAGVMANPPGILGVNHFAGASFSGLVGEASFTTKAALPFLGAYSATSGALPTAVSYGEVFGQTASGGGGIVPNLFAAQGLSWL